MANNEALRAIVIKALDASGTLGQIKAQVRASVYKIIDGQDNSSKGKSGFAWENPLSKKLHENNETHYLLCLIAEFFEFYEMEYSLSVYSQEANLSKKDYERNNISKSAGIQKIDSNKSVLQQMVSEFLKGNTSKGAAFPTGFEDEKKKEKITVNEEKEKEKVRPTVITGSIKSGATTTIGGNSTTLSGANKAASSTVKETAASTKKGKSKDEEEEEDFSYSKLKPLITKPDNNKLVTLPGGKGASKTSAYGSLGGSSGGDPYNFDFPSETDAKTKNSTIKSTNDTSKGKNSNAVTDKKLAGATNNSNKFNSYSSKKVEDDDDRLDSIGDEIDEEVPDYEEEEIYGKNETKEKGKIMSSSEDYLGASQSMGVDKSVDSMALEEYDYFEDVEEY